MIQYVVVCLLLASFKCIDSCKKIDQYCSCDDKCMSYGDCCPGHVHFNKPGLLDDILSCKQVNLQKISIIDKCADRNHSLSNFCKKIEIIPNNRLKSLVPVKTSEGDIYENAFCAICNGKNIYEYLSINIECYDGKPKSFKEANALVNNQSCYVAPIFPEDITRNCHRNLIRHCQVKNDWNYNETVQEFCEKKIYKYVHIVMSGKAHYRNDYCCACWNDTCFSPFFSDFKNSFTYLLDFNEWDKEGGKNKSVPEFVGNLTSSTIGDVAIFYISYTLTIVSMISLIILIVIYGSQRIFHTFGGYLTICLSACLLLMNLLTLLLIDERLSTSVACFYLGIVQHFIALSNFIWMAIYALDLLQTFGLGTSTRGKKKSFKTFLIYCVIVFGIAGAFVGAASVTEFKASANSTVRPKYGGSNCWFTSKLGGIIWYFAPVCILLTWNFIACIVVFYKLSKTAKECRAVQQNESNNTLWLCMRLTAVFGIGYLFQVVSVLIGARLLIVIGSIINCLQGCLLAACFAWTKRVRAVISGTIASVTGSVAAQNSTQTQSITVARVTDKVNSKVKV